MPASTRDDDRTDLRRQLQELTDRAEITDLVHRTYRWLDEGAGDPRSFFTADVRAETPGGRVEGIDRVIAQATRNHTPDNRYQHALTNVLVDVDGDHATVRLNLQLTIAPATAAPGALAPAPAAQLGERSYFEAARTAEGWRLSVVRHRQVWLSGSLPRPQPAS